MGQSVVCGDSATVLAGMDERSLDALITDPPYGLSKEPDAAEVLRHWLVGDDYEHTGSGFMGRSWDSFVPGPSVWSAVLRVMKPGAYGAIFASSRTYDLMGMSLRLAGFEIRDTIMWLYGQGFPKSKGHLKPGHEPIILVRRPCEGSAKRNAERWGTGSLQVEQARIGEEVVRGNTWDDGMEPFGGGAGHAYSSSEHQGRWPANVALGHGDDCTDSQCALDCPISVLDAQSGATRSTGGRVANISTTSTIYGGGKGLGIDLDADAVRGDPGYGDQGGASRFFYRAKANKRERSHGLPEGMVNDHPTVKPVHLIRWLVRLLTPPDGVVLDPFAGSGTTGVAAREEGRGFLGVELDERYAQIARERIAAVR